MYWLPIALDHDSHMGRSLLIRIIKVQWLQEIFILEPILSASLTLAHDPVEIEQTWCGAIFVLQVDLPSGVNNANQIMLQLTCEESGAVVIENSQPLWITVGG